MSLLLWALLLSGGCTPSPSPLPSSSAMGAVFVGGDARDLSGSHTTPVSAGCTRDVAGPGGVAGALASVKPGDVVCFGAGIYPTLVVDGVRGTASAPIVFRTAPDAKGTARFTSGTLAFGDAISVIRSEHIHLYDLHLAHAQKGLTLMSVGFVRVEGLLIEDLGQEAIAIGALHTWDGSDRFLAPASHHVDVIGNTLRDTGKVTARYGEGVYVGTGGFGGDETHDILIAYNTMSQLRAEGVDLKVHTYNHIVRGNVISHSSHRFHAAITLGVAPADARDGNYLIEDNRIFDYSSTDAAVAGIGIGHGNAIVRNNLIWDIRGGSGIRTYRTFGNPEARQVVLERNTIWNPGGQALALHDGDEGTGVSDRPGVVMLDGNLAEGGPTADASAFLGPVTGSADRGEGPGSGFRLAVRPPAPR